MSLKIISPGTVYLGSATGSGGGGGSASLFDIKCLSQAIAEKGWAFQGYSTRQDLSKDDIPTVYTDIKTKYDNCDSAPSSNYTIFINNSTIPYLFCCDDTYIYSTTTSQNQSPNYLRRTPISLFPTTNWESTGIDVFGSGGVNPIKIGDNLIVFTAQRNSDTRKIYIYKKSDFTFIKSIDNVNGSSDRPLIYLTKVNGIKTFFVSYPNTDNSFTLVKIEDNISATVEVLRTDLTNFIGQPAYKENTNTFWFYYSGNSSICKTTDNFQTIDIVKSHGHSYYANQPPATFIKNDVIMVTANDRLSPQSVYTEDNGLTWKNTKNKFGNDVKIGCLPSFDGDTMYCNIWDSGADTHLYSSTDLKTFTIFMPNETNGAGNELVTYEPIKNTIFITSDRTKYLGIVKTVYTDTYTIGGSSINVNYYKYGSFKICVKDGGTNDANIDTVYNALGYENYFVIDDTNETVALPRNSNLWSFMYVGDNYISDNIPDGNSTRLLPQASSITDMTSTSITFDSTNKVQPNTDYEYGQLTTLTLGSSSIISSKLGTTIKFQSGTPATTITDSSNIQWVDGAKPEPSASKTCLIFIWDNTGFYKEW